MDTHEHLIDDHIDGDLTDDRFRRLEGWLRESDDHVREFTTQWLIHSVLHDFISQRQVQADALLRAMTAMPASGGEPHAATVALASPADRSQRLAEWRDAGPMQRSAFHRFVLQPRRLAGIAALLVFAATASILAYFTTRPQVAAMLTQSANCRWESSKGDIADGALFLEGDQLRLTEGRALVTFASGARVVIEGPSTLIVESPMSARLAEGALTAKVPTQAIGFTIDSPRAQFIDLGTEFTLRCRGDDSLELQVFEGLVELKMLDDAPLRISEGTAVKIEAASPNVQSIPYDVGQKIAMP